ncbi:hypothetical protein O181_047142 [Austropuccinia psidii MF-1]|uniref:Uncharacterized protein n=1 Tax=Austropuccinia psidii MF-1 TaxID=1389203 RepID=A0A9Q3DSM0_9BASI|nr:hypothetical protein [Austropuccinia psidii MF-1]
MQHPSSKPKPRQRLSMVMRKMSTKKMGAGGALARSLVKENTQSTLTDQQNLQNFDNIKEVPATPKRSRPLLRSNTQTMQMYDFQRSDTIPLRVPGLFPANLNFTQKTFCLLGNSNQEDAGRDCNCYMEELLGTPQSLPSPPNSKEKVNTTPTKNAIPLLPEKLSQLHSNFKARTNSLNFYLKSKKSFNALMKNQAPKSPPLFSNQTFSHSFKSSKKVNSKDGTLSPNLGEQAPWDHQDSTRIIAPQTKLTEIEKMSLCSKTPTSSSLKTFEHQQVIPPKDHPKIPEGFDVVPITVVGSTDKAPTTPEFSLNSTECPKLQIVLDSSPLFRNEAAQFEFWSPNTESTSSNNGTPSYASYSSHATTPSTSTSKTPETPTTFLGSPIPGTQCNPESKFSWATGSPGIINRRTLPSGSEIRLNNNLQIALQRSPSLTSPVSQRVSWNQKPGTRGPGADMLAALELLAELCQNSQSCLEDKESSFEYQSKKSSQEYE